MRASKHLNNSIGSIESMWTFGQFIGALHRVIWAHSFGAAGRSLVVFWIGRWSSSLLGDLPDHIGQRVEAGQEVVVLLVRLRVHLRACQRVHVREVDQLQTAVEFTAGVRVDEEDRGADELEQIHVHLLEPFADLVELLHDGVDYFLGLLFARLLQEEPNELLLVFYRTFSAGVTILLLVDVLLVVPFLQAEKNGRRTEVRIWSNLVSNRNSRRARSSC